MKTGAGTQGAFNRATRHAAFIAGKPATIATAFAAVLAWAVAGPFLGFSENWQLTINTATTIITFLMVFIIQNSQNRDSLAVQIKLDELLRAQKSAKNILFDLEELSEEELEKLQSKYEGLQETARRRKREHGGILPLNTARWSKRSTTKAKAKKPRRVGEQSRPLRSRAR